MADLLAIISTDRSRQVDPSPLRAAYEELRGGATSEFEASAGWAAVRVLDHPRPPQAGVEEENGAWTAWAGLLSGAAGPHRTPLAELDGQFSLVRLEPGGETLRVAADPLGMKPLFVAERDGQTYVSSSALVLARLLRSTPSPLGLETFLRAGTQFGAATHWEGIERLRPGEALSFRPGGSERGAYWLPRIEPEVRALGLEECAELVADRDTTAIAANYAGQHPWLDLTGGFDSRLVALLCQRAGVSFMTNTSGSDQMADVRIARLVAARRGWPWTQLTLPADWSEGLAAGIGAAVAWGDGHLEAMQLTEVLLGHRRKAEQGTTLLTGGAGEHYRDHPWGHELWRAGRSTTVDIERMIAWRVMGPVDLSVFRRDPTAAVSAALREEMEARVAPFAGSSNTFQSDLLYALKSSGHFGAYQAAAGAWIHMELPLYLKQPFTTVISVAPRHRNFHRMLREMMQRLDPEIAAMETDTGGPAEPLRIGNAYRFAPYVWRRGKRFGARLRPRRASGAEREPDPVEVARGQLVARLREEGKLDPATMRSGPLFDPDRLGELLATAAARPAAADWTTVGRVVTTELELEAAGAGLG